VPRDHLLRTLLAEARRESRATVLTPGRLTASDVGQLVVAGGRDESLGPRLHRETGGLPFFVVEYLDALARDGTVAPEWPLPGGVRDLLERRLDDLGDLARQVVAAGAVLGRPFEPALVRETSGRGDEETVAALEELVRRGVLVEEADGSFDFRHEQARDLAYTRLSIARRRLLHRRAASTLDAGPGRAARAATVAAHLAAAGDDAEAAGRYRAAGDAARKLYANAEALAHYRAALALGDPDPSALHATIGDLETLAGDYGAAFASYETAVALAPPGRRGRVEWRIGLLHMRRGQWERAEASLEAAAEGLDVVDAALVLADRALVAYRLAREDDARARADAALAAAAGVGEPRAVAQAHNVAGVLATARGDANAAIADLEVAVSVAREAGDDAAQTAALNNLALALRSTGDVVQATVVAERALALCVPRGDRHREAAIRNNLADLLRASGRDEDAMVQLKHAVALFAEIGEHGRLEPEIWKLSEW
jgi:tetratricopeptide (TPR) repeat protein